MCTCAYSYHSNARRKQDVDLFGNKYAKNLKRIMLTSLGIRKLMPRRKKNSCADFKPTSASLQ